jgi:pimeloyl-ACP methyl ester carboxylesterase
MNFAAGLATSLAQSPITERFDLVGFDPRGVGATTPAVDCFTDEEVRAGTAPQSEFLVSAGTLTEDGARQLVERCARGPGGEQALAAVATRDTVRDMDVLRAALGEEQLTFLGQSYGTRVGAFYAAEYPQRVRAVLSGPDDGGRLTNFAEAAYAIVCMDEDRLTVEQARDVRGRIHQVAPFADPGRGVDGARDSCAAWPAPPKPTYPFPERVAGLPPTLVVSITGDPTTPYDAGTRLADALGGSLLTVEGEQHTVVAAGTNACVADIAAAYLVDLRTPPADARCVL